MNMVVVTVGVAIASYGEMNFVVVGVLLQLLSVATESTRLSLVQILLQVRTDRVSFSCQILGTCSWQLGLVGSKQLQA